MSTETLPPDYFDDDLGDCDYPQYQTIPCAACGGTGLAPEGWDCEECDGYGDFEI